MTTDLQITVDGRWISLDYLYGDVQKAHVWPGGDDELSWSIAGNPPRRVRGGEKVKAFVGPVCVWSGLLLEPDSSQDRLVAQGLWRSGDDYYAIDGSGDATTVPDTAIDQAISRGLPWTRPTSVSSSAVDQDVSQGPITVGALLDAWTTQAGSRWGVNPAGEVVTKADDTAPTYQTRPLEGGLGYDLSAYASTLLGRYQFSGGYDTAIRTNTPAETDHGHKEAVVDLTPKGIITSTKANNLLDNLLALGRAIPAYTQNIEVTPGELLNMGGVPVALETVPAGVLVRVHGGFDLPWRRSGGLYMDVPVGMAALAGGVLNLTPAQMATATNFTDLATAALTK